MTCDEFIKLVKNNDPQDVTRAERAAIIAHADKCPKCRRKITEPLKMTTEYIMLDPVTKKRVDQALIDQKAADINERLYNQDILDPEFQDIVIGGEG